MLGPRTELALAYARENGVNRIEGARDAWLGVVVPGKAYFDLMHALRGLGLYGAALERAGIRVLKLGMVSPLEPQIARRHPNGLAVRELERRRRPSPRRDERHLVRRTLAEGHAHDP